MSMNEDEIEPTVMEIHLNTGAMFTVEVGKFKTVKDRQTQRITGMEWTTPAGASRRLHSVDLDTIVAIVEVTP